MRVLAGFSVGWVVGSLLGATLLRRAGEPVRLLLQTEPLEEVAWGTRVRAAATLRAVADRLEGAGPGLSPGGRALSAAQRLVGDPA